MFERSYEPIMHAFVLGCCKSSVFDFVHKSLCLVRAAIDQHLPVFHEFTPLCDVSDIVDIA